MLQLTSSIHNDKAIMIYDIKFYAKIMCGNYAKSKNIQRRKK